MLEVITQWTGLGKSPKLSIMHFGGASQADAQAASEAVRAFWQASQPAFVTSLQGQMSSEVREINAITGDLDGVFTVLPGLAFAGSGSGQQAADATQYLLRWTTGAIADGRRVQGRTFVPGVPVANIANGNVSAAVVASWASRIGAFLTAAPTFSVWHRPVYTGPPGNRVLDRPGSVHTVNGGSCWTEYAVQRRRRG